MIIMILMMKDLNMLFKMKLMKDLFLLLIIGVAYLANIVLIEIAMEKITIDMIGYLFLI